MALLPIYETPDPVLRQISSPVEEVDDALRALIDDMFDTMYAAPGIGLARSGQRQRLLGSTCGGPRGGCDGQGPAVFINRDLETSGSGQPYQETPVGARPICRGSSSDRVRARWLDVTAGGRMDRQLLAVCRNARSSSQRILFIVTAPEAC
jgi:peptide deformylase